MKQDIDRLMTERNLDAIIVSGPDGLTGVNPSWHYMVNGEHLQGLVVQRRGEAPTLIYNLMERQQAEATGLALIQSDHWNMRDLLAEYGNRTEASLEWHRRVFAELGITGRVGWYGTVNSSQFLAIVQGLQRTLPDLEIVGEYENALLDIARRTKDATEIAHMTEVGRKTCAVVDAVRSFIAAQHTRDGVIVDAQGQPVTIATIRRVLRGALEAHNLDESDGTIFAQGRDAGIPHASGNDAEALRVGEAIIFDSFPRDRATGYYHDMTRTWSIGAASAELEAVYDDVLTSFHAVVASLQVGGRTRAAQDLVCEMLHERGHITTAQESPIEEGYVHSLGHGLGLEIHEPLPFSSLIDTGDTLAPGQVFTIEPGLYYPSRNLGVRIEDVFVCDPDGTFRSLTPFSYDLVIPVGSEI